MTTAEPPEVTPPTIDIEPIIAAFLSDYPTLFMQMKTLNKETGEFYWYEWDGNASVEMTTRETPDIYFIREDWNDSEQHFGYYDRDGNRIESAPWLGTNIHIHTSNEYAGSFTLWDFDGNGIPTIIIHFRPYPNMPSCYMGYWQAFRFVDGEYRLVSVTCDYYGWYGESDYKDDFWRTARGGNDYYFDDDGNLIARFRTNHLDGGGAHYSRIEFNRNKVVFTAIAGLKEAIWEGENETDTPDYSVWENFIAGTTVTCYIDVYSRHPEAHLLPGSDIMLTPIEPMTDLQERIIRSKQ
jgi:hypothetical protein